MESSNVLVHLVVGEDPSLLSHATSKLVGELCGTERDLLFEEVSLEGDLTGTLRSVSLFSDTQVVLFRAKTLEEPRLSEVLEYLASPEPSSVLVLSLSKASAAVVKAVNACGGRVVKVAGKNHHETARSLLADSPVRLDRPAGEFLRERVGEDVGRIPSILNLLHSVHGSDKVLGVLEVEPFVGSAGMVPLWELSDLVDKGDAPNALRTLSRLLDSKPPIPVLSVLSSHFERMFRLSQAGITSEKVAAEFLGMKGSTYPAKKAIMSARRYGGSLPGALELIADAATDIRGGSSLPPKLVLEVLVARLAMRPR